MSNLEKLKSLLSHKQSKNYYARKLSVSEAEIEELLWEIKNGNNPKTEEERIINNEKGTLTLSVTSDYEPKSDVELAKEHKVDLKKYKIIEYYSKKSFNGKFRSTLRCGLIKKEENFFKDFELFLSKYSPTHNVLISPVRATGEEVDVVLSIADFHLDRKTIKDDDIDDRVGEYLSAVQSLALDAAQIKRINNFHFIIGNDFFNNDNYQGSTTNGTPQDNSLDFANSYEIAFDTLVSAINILRSNAKNVNVILVQGNHDRTKSFYVAHALEIFFKNSNVTFSRDNSNTKHFTIGNTFIGLHHGNCKIDELPLLFSTSSDSSKEFGNAKYREICVADKHHYLTKEIKGVRIHQMPSMVNPDRWSNDNLFLNNVRAAIALIYHPIKGKIGELEYRI